MQLSSVTSVSQLHRNSSAGHHRTPSDGIDQLLQVTGTFAVTSE